MPRRIESHVGGWNRSNASSDYPASLPSTAGCHVDRPSKQKDLPSSLQGATELKGTILVLLVLQH